MDIDIMQRQLNELMEFKKRAEPMLLQHEIEQHQQRAGQRDERGEQREDEREGDREQDRRREAARGDDKDDTKGGPGEPGRATAHPDAHHDARDAGHGRSGRDK